MNGPVPRHKRLHPIKLVRVYEQLHARVPDATRPALQIAVMCRKPLEEVLLTAQELGIEAHTEECPLSGLQAAAIIRKLFDLE